MQINVSKYYPDRYIKAEHLDGSCDLAIESVREEELTGNDGKAEDRIIVSFAEPVSEHGPRELVLNKGRLQAMIEAMGSSDSDQWIGRLVTILPSRIPAFGKMVDTVLVESKAPSQHVLADNEDVAFDAM